MRKLSARLDGSASIVEEREEERSQLPTATSQHRSYGILGHGSQDSGDGVAVVGSVKGGGEPPANVRVLTNLSMEVVDGSDGGGGCGRNGRMMMGSRGGGEAIGTGEQWCSLMRGRGLNFTLGDKQTKW